MRFRYGDIKCSFYSKNVKKCYKVVGVIVYETDLQIFHIAVNKHYIVKYTGL